MILKIPSATPNETDAAQYIIRNGKNQYNLCGEFCVAYCLQDETHTDTIDEFLDYWQAKNLKWYQTLFPNGIGRTTSIYDLKRMIEEYEYPPPSLLFSGLPVNPYVIQATLNDYQAIVGVQIDHAGYLVGRGIYHWVVLDAINVVDKLHSIVYIYNPFTNNIEPYSWREFMTSTGAYKNGLWIKRSLEKQS